jgi:hypothetical protein
MTGWFVPIFAWLAQRDWHVGAIRKIAAAVARVAVVPIVVLMTVVSVYFGFFLLTLWVEGLTALLVAILRLIREALT